ncbi:ethanolamine utilization protein EutP [Anoxybacterium hadale]|uniref:Ethanolamine utilization protein EutP n=1 Tax=Anoxybacterium hadale TaxID=3408580 RepID=A0ACD1ACT1_9FIRM|nr:ethanolamine utilization protein EutP [Clostridiales bacterium]
MRYHQDMKRRIMLIGNSRVGKSSLANCINSENLEVMKSQAISYGKNTIDTPGEYLESPMMHKYIISASQDADAVLFVQSFDQPIFSFPPNFAQVFNCPKIGVITKADLKEKRHELRLLSDNFKQMGVAEPYFITSSHTKSGIEELKKYLSSL